MNVEIGAEAALFPEKEYISGIFVAGWLQNSCMRQSFSLAVNALVLDFLIGRTLPPTRCISQSFSLAVNAYTSKDFLIGRTRSVALSHWLSMLESELSDWKNAVQPPSWRAGRTCRAASTRSSWRTPGTTATPTPRPAHPSTICSPHQDTVSHAYFCLQTTHEGLHYIAVAA
jgi:hypothetical protein